MIQFLLKALSHIQTNDEDIRFAQGSEEYPTTIKETLNKMRWQLRRR